jgi:hypothetical protein
MSERRSRSCSTVQRIRRRKRLGSKTCTKGSAVRSKRIRLRFFFSLRSAMHAFASDVASEKRRKGAGRVNHPPTYALGMGTGAPWASLIIYVLYVLYVLASDQRKTADLLLKLRGLPNHLLNSTIQLGHSIPCVLRRRRGYRGYGSRYTVFTVQYTCRPQPMACHIMSIVKSLIDF